MGGLSFHRKYDLTTSPPSSSLIKECVTSVRGDKYVTCIIVQMRAINMHVNTWMSELSCHPSQAAARARPPPTPPIHGPTVQICPLDSSVGLCAAWATSRPHQAHPLQCVMQEAGGSALLGDVHQVRHSHSSTIQVTPVSETHVSNDSSVRRGK
jgi:hypothetical protein